jgi:predicted ABC-type ATPase
VTTKRRRTVADPTEPSPLLIFLAGSNGAGKSTFFETYLADLGLSFVNADRIAKALQEARPQRTREMIDREAFKEAEQLRKAFLEARNSFCTETVFSDPAGAKIRFLKEARRKGFAVILVFVGIASDHLSIARVMQHVSQGGHDVPDAKLRTRYPRTLKNLQAAIPIADVVYFLDNSSVEFPYRPVAVYTEDELTENRPPIPLWAKGLPGLRG